MVNPTMLSALHRGTAALIVLLGTCLSFFTWRYVAKEEADQIHSGFMSRAQTQATVAGQRLRNYEEMVYSLRDTFLSQNEVTRGEFTQAACALLARHTGVQALEWVQIVPRGRRAGLEQQASAELGRPFTVRRRLADNTMQVAPEDEEYWVIDYLEPLAGNEVVLGYDVKSSPAASLLATARADRQFKVSQPFQLVQSRGLRAEPGVTFILPFARPNPPESPVEGFVQGVFLVQTMLAQSHQITTNEALDSYYLDVTAGSARPTLLYANLAGVEPLRTPGAIVTPPPLDDPADFHDIIKIGDRRWHLIIRANAAWVEQMASRQPALILGAGLTITALLALFINSLLHRTSRIEQVVQERTRQLHASEAQLQDIIDHSPALIFLKDLDGRYLLCNQPFASICRQPHNGLLGKRDDELFPAAEARLYRENDAKVIAAGRPVEFEEPTTAPTGRRTWIVQKFPLLDEQGRAYALCGIATDITERKRAEAELQESRRQLSNLISQLPGAAFRCVFSEKLTALFVSEGMLTLTGYPAEDFTSGRVDIASLTVPADRPAVRESVTLAIRERRNVEVEYRITHRDGREKWVLVRGRPIFDEAGGFRFVEGLAIDVTALKQAELEKLAFERNLLETQKLESLGVMAGGIAHDFNNILTAVLGNASLARMALPPADPGQENLLRIEKAVRRAADLCSQMLAYSGKGRFSVGPINLSNLVRDTTAMLEVSIRKNCRLALQLADSLPSVTGDAAQLNQIVMNLVINASDAIGERADGKIKVTTFAVQADPALFQTALHQPKLPPGLYAGLEVRDNGCGMTPEIITRIFEPFFTTKFSGRGLGLSAVLGIVQGHHGALFVESQPGLGSTFRLLLPTLETSPEAKPGTDPSPARQRMHGTVLVVDDEEDVRQVTGAMLEQQGASVLLAADGSQALELYREQRDKIDLILLDLTMPGLSGEEVLRRLQLLGARQRIVVMSGYSEEETMQRCTALGAAGFLRKPFELETVMAKLLTYLG